MLCAGSMKRKKKERSQNERGTSRFDYFHSLSRTVQVVIFTADSTGTRDHSRRDECGPDDLRNLRFTKTIAK